MGLGQYTVRYTGGLGQAPSARTFAALGVTQAKIVSLAGGGDYAEITVVVSIGAAGMPFVPLARHDIYDGGGTLRFVGWLMQPARSASADDQVQTFRLDGPMSQLGNEAFQQPWNYADDPTNYNSTVTPKMTPRVILNLENDVTGTRINVAAQIKEMLDYFIGLYPTNGAPVAYGSLAAIPTVQPPEDEQTDAYCDAILARQLRWVPKVTTYWTYPPGVPIKPVLNFSANDAVPATSIVGGVAIVPGQGLVPLSGYQSVLIDPTSGTLASFKSAPRYDLLVSKVTVLSQAESEVTADGSPTGQRKVWATLDTDVSTAENGSGRELTYCFDLRGAGGLRDPATGLMATPQEPHPTGLAAALHEPFKVLTHSLEWSVVAEDVNWSTIVGAAVGVRNGGDDLLKGSRSIIQQISRDIGTGTTSYQAGPPAHLGMDDIVALTRFNRTRNAARSGGGNGGGYGWKGGKDQKKTGSNPPLDRGTGGTSAAAATPADFSLYDASTTSGGTTTLKVGVQFGCVTPYLSADGLLPWPSNFMADNQYKYEFAVTAFGAAWIVVTNDTSGDLNKASAIALASGAEPPVSDDTHGIKVLGTWDVDTSVTPHKVIILSGKGANGIGSQQYEFIGGIHAWGPS